MNVLFEENIFQADTNNFDSLALELFQFQAMHNGVYRSFIEALRIDPAAVRRLEDIPYLPIGFFKSHEVKTTNFTPALVFESSGTTQSVNSQHWLKDASVYEESFLRGFELFYGNPEDWCILGLLPSYLERQHSSLVYMVEELVKRSGHNASGFYLYDHEKLAEQLVLLEAARQPTLLIGVTFGLLDFAEQYSLSLKHTIVMETGGMKGRREEWTREQVHGYLKQRLGVPTIHSEYGMTELLSQGYSKGEGLFNTVPWMKLLVREEDDPMRVKREGRGVLNVIDLANVYSCAFLATEDVGNLFADESFEVLGRLDNSDIRGCSLMAL